MHIKKLDEVIINQIAAGEVIERPANVVKELIENSIDAGATKITIATVQGGKALIRVSDNGAGIDKSEIKLALLRHCTSKITDNVSEIYHLGFRGEALPSIASVSKLTLSSRTQNSEVGYKIAVKGGEISEIEPTAQSYGTIVEVRDLFYATPARLKFLKSDKAENIAISQIVKNLSLAYPQISFSVTNDEKTSYEYFAKREDDFLGRICDVIGANFAENSIEITAERQDIKLQGYIGNAASARGNNLGQFIFVNKRPIKDKALLGAIRAGYMDILPKDRYAICVLYFTMDSKIVDVNVHPAKAEVRFINPALIRSMIVSSIRNALRQIEITPATINSQKLSSAFQKYDFEYKAELPRKNNYLIAESFKDLDLSPVAKSISDNEIENTAQHFKYPLGGACAQIHKNYIISQTEDGMILVDQHASHERIIYEKLKQTLSNKAIKSQNLLIPEIVHLNEEKHFALMSCAAVLANLALHIEEFGTNSVLVRSIPAILGDINVANLINEIADKLLENEDENLLEQKIHYIAATMACHGSVRAGHIFNIAEMNNLLREMEQTPSSYVCNHGRPTFIKLTIKEIEKLFERD